MSGGITRADSSARAWEEATIAEAEAYAQEQADARAAERSRQDAAQSQSSDSGHATSSPGRGAPTPGSGATGRSEPPTAGLDGRTLTPGERTFLVKVPPEDAAGYIASGVTVIPDGEGGHWIDTRSVPSIDFVEEAPPPTHWLPDYGSQPPSVTTPGEAEPWPPAPSTDPPAQPSLIQADDLSPKGLFKLGAAILAGIGKLLGKEAAEKILKEGLERVGKEALSPLQAANLARFEKKLPSAAGPVSIYEVPGGGRVFQAEVPGRVPGSKAIYEKHVSASGETLHVVKTTFDPNGNVVHVKDKVSGEVME